MIDAEHSARDRSADSAADLAGPHSPRVRKGPALIVIVIALSIIVLGALLAAIPSKSSPSAVGKVVRVATGTEAGYQSIEVVPAAGVLNTIADNGALPSDVEGALVVPAGSRRTGSENLDGNAGQYDRQITLVAPYRAADLVKCYQQELPHLGWTLSSTQANSNVNGVLGTEVLAQHLASDGYYWEVGVIISNDSPTITPALGGSSASSTSSTIHLELLEVPDGN